MRLSLLQKLLCPQDSFTCGANFTRRRAHFVEKDPICLSTNEVFFLAEKEGFDPFAVPGSACGSSPWQSPTAAAPFASLFLPQAALGNVPLATSLGFCFFHKIKQHTRLGVLFYLAEKEGFEPSRPFRALLP